MQEFRLLPHLVTSDVAFEAFGKTPNELFANAALATFSVMCDIKTVEPLVKKDIVLTARSLEDLLFDFLNELIFLKDRDSMLFAKFKINTYLNDIYHLSAEVAGEKIDNSKHNLGVDVKAVTKHEFKVEKKGEFYKAVVALDI